ncbi:hypothetical protein Tco_1434039 [Tanacetum coccineum]
MINRTHPAVVSVVGWGGSGGCDGDDDDEMMMMAVVLWCVAWWRWCRVAWQRRLRWVVVMEARDSAWWWGLDRSGLGPSFCSFWVRRKSFSDGGDRGRPVAAGYNGREGRERYNGGGISLTEPFNDTYETPKHTKKVFTNMKRKGKDFSGRVTPLFASMLAPLVVGGKGSGQPSKPQPPSSTTQPIIEEQIPVTELSSPQNTQSARQALQKDTQLPQTSVLIPNVADEAVFKERDDRVVPRNHEGAIAQTRSERASKHSYDSPLLGVNTPGSDEERNKQQDLMDFAPPTPHDSLLSGGHTPGSDEGRPNINELMAICTNLSNRVLALEQSKTAQDLVINKLQKKVKRLEKALRARTPGMKLFKIGTSRRKGLDKENVSKQGRKSDKTKPMFEDSDFVELDMENVKGDAKTQGRNTIEHGDTVNTASINVSGASPSTSTTGDIFEDEMTTIVDTLTAI